MIGLELSPDNKFAAAFTNNNTTILLNTLISEFFIIESMLGPGETVEGLVLLDSNLVIYGQYTWGVFDLKGNLTVKYEFSGPGQILWLRMVDSLDQYSVTSWTGDTVEGSKPEMTLQTYKSGIPANPLDGHSVVIVNLAQNRAFICADLSNFTVSSFVYKDGFWKKERNFTENDSEILMLELSKNEKWCCATLLNGFKLWNVKEDKEVRLKLPNGIRNISKKFNQSNMIVLSAGDRLAVSGIRQELVVWSMDTGLLVHRLVAHFQRIVEIKSLVTKNENAVLTSSIDRSIKVWNLDYIFEKEHHIDKHELTIDNVNISTSAQIAVVVTRSCIGIWDFMTGELKARLANSALGAIITHALVNEEGSYIVAAESGDVLYWSLETRSVVFQEKQENIQQIFFYKEQTRCVVVSKTGSRGNYTGVLVSRSVPDGDRQWQLQYPFVIFMEVVMTADEHHVVCYDADKTKNNLYIYSMKTGALVHKMMVRYPGLKEVSKLVALPDKPSVVALIDVDKGNLMDINQRRFMKSIPFWDGTCSTDGKYGLYAPPTGGMDMLDLRTGKVFKTLIPKVSEGIFDVMAVFNATNEYVLYYHSGRKTIRAFRRKDGKMIANFRVQADLKGMETTTDGRSVVLGMGDGSMTTLLIADPEKTGMSDYLASLPSRNPEVQSQTVVGRRKEGVFLQNGVEYPSPYDYSIYTDYLKALQQCIPPASE